MKKNRIKAYWLLLLVLLYAAGAVLSVGEAQARYVTTATWNTVVQQEADSVTSDCLDDPDENLTILLGTMPQEPYPVSFQLTAGENVSGSLNWTVDQQEYISVEMRIGDTLITPETIIEITSGEPVTVVMTLTPTGMAFTEVREAVSVSVAVTWADTLQGTFLTQLPAVEEEEEPTEETEPEPTEETEPPADTTEPPAETTEPPAETTEPPAEETQPDPAEPGADVTDLRMPVSFHKAPPKNHSHLTTNNETSDDQTSPEEETTEPVTETEPAPADEAEEPSEESDPSEPETPDTEDPSEPTEPIQEEPTEMTILLETAGSVNPADALPVQITAPESGGQVHLGVAAVIEPTDPEGERQTVLDNFPRYTRFRLGDGASCYMLYHADTIALDLEAGETVSVLLDLSHVTLDQFQVVLGAASQSGGGGISTCTVTVIPESAQYTSVSSRILSVGVPLEITVSEFWKDYDLEYVVEMLTTISSGDGETEALGYVPAELPENCLLAEVISDETGTKINFSIGDTLPPAGTYRVSLNWIFEETCCAQMQETFFINYLAYTESEETGGAEQ